ncbi:hypothetical protein LNV08_22875 [Paucibacter sp. TC2R-5]|uniref:hypothetical protein n=1 Tax=Paucibacter sp. TC2R-5 TaxID=2893555 RepID=UPI0021E3F861|nr:hypothetical protein [Paucibacter sp. TC2R-5]MCV2361805.1 hypothetical protein [Paucibacter sp. TC2R-5]
MKLTELGPSEATCWVVIACICALENAAQSEELKPAKVVEDNKVIWAVFKLEMNEAIFSSLSELFAYRRNFG